MTRAALAAPAADPPATDPPADPAADPPAAPAADPATMSTPYLPFDMPVGTTTKMVFAHYVPWFPISLDNLPAEQDYYTTQYMNPEGEGGQHVATGGYLRDRPLPRAPINDPNWQLDDLITEVNQAKSVGINGFDVDIVLPSYEDTQIRNLLTAAQSSGNFSIMPTADMSGPLSTFTSSDFAAAFAPYLESPGAYRLSDGRVVLSAFYAEAEPASWWSDTLTDFHDDYGLNVAFVPIFLDAASNMDSFAPISYGFSNWGGRNYADTDPTATFPGTQVSLVNQAHALGKIWMQPIAFQDERPYQGTYEESGNTLTNSNDWQIATDDGAEWANLVTWNDYAEGTAMAPSEEHGYRMLDMQAYNIADFKYGTDPTIVRDALYVSNRIQFADAQPTYPETEPMELVAGTPAATNTVDVVTFATAPATVVADIGGVVSTCQVGAGRSVCTFPLQVGDITVSLVRDGVTTTQVQSPYSVTATPYVQDEEYHVAGGLR